jgi:hypothetical protein
MKKENKVTYLGPFKKRTCHKEENFDNTTAIEEK